MFLKKSVHQKCFKFNKHAGNANLGDFSKTPSDYVLLGSPNTVILFLFEQQWMKDLTETCVKLTFLLEMWCHSVVFSQLIKLMLHFFCYPLLCLIFNEVGTKYMQQLLLGEHAHLKGEKVEMKGKQDPLMSEDSNDGNYKRQQTVL